MLAYASLWVCYNTASGENRQATAYLISLIDPFKGHGGWSSLSFSSLVQYSVSIDLGGSSSLIEALSHPYHLSTT